MSQHPSLSASQKGKRHRSVLKRYERLKHLMEKDKWDEKSSIYNLPKIKSIKFKVKKEKAAPAEAEVVAAEGAPAATTGAQPQTSAKPEGATAATKQPALEKQVPTKEKKGKA